MKILGPIPCIRCGKTVWWDRETVGKLRRYRLMEGDAKHVCVQKKAKAAA